MRWQNNWRYTNTQLFLHINKRTNQTTKQQINQRMNEPNNQTTKVLNPLPIKLCVYTRKYFCYITNKLHKIIKLELCTVTGDYAQLPVTHYYRNP
jgi:hypothetical protein